MVPLHFFLHIHPRIVDALTPNVGRFVEYTVKQANAEVGHSDFISIGKTEGKARFHTRFVLYDLTVLATGISAWFGDGF